MNLTILAMPREIATLRSLFLAEMTLAIIFDYRLAISIAFLGKEFIEKY